MRDTTLAYVNKPPLAGRSFWYWRGLAAASGALLGLAAAERGLAALAWLAPAGLFFALLVGGPYGKPLSEWAIRGGAFGFCYYFMALREMLMAADNLSLPQWQARGLVLLALLAVCLGLCLIWAAAAWLCGFLRLGQAASLCYWPLAWYLIEWGLGHLFGGLMPLVCLGTSLAPWPLFCQSGALWGAYGVSALIAGFGVLLAGLVLWRSWHYLLLAGLVFALNLAAGALLMEPQTAAAEADLVAATSHMDVSFPERWGGESDEEIFRNLAGQVGAAAQAGAELILLPETALPYELSAGEGWGQRYLQLAMGQRICLVAGGFSQHEGRDYNALFTVSSGGSLAEVYTKRALVPFGEHIPLRPLTLAVFPDGFFDNIPMTELASGGEQGAWALPLPGGRQVMAAGIICYDVCFPDYPRRAVREGAQVLLAASNDVWYADSSVVYQHFNHGVLRAIEYGRPLISSTNGGISAVIDDYGRVLAQAEPGEMAAAGISLPQRQTAYALFGPYLIWLFLALWLGVCFLGWLWHPMYSDNGARFAQRNKPNYHISSLFHR